MSTNWMLWICSSNVSIYSKKLPTLKSVLFIVLVRLCLYPSILVRSRLNFNVAAMSCHLPLSGMCKSISMNGKMTFKFVIPFEMAEVCDLACRRIPPVQPDLDLANKSEDAKSKGK